MAIVSIKPGVQFKYDSLALGRMLATLLLLEYPGAVIITSGSEGVHVKTSRHYRGEAIDIRSANLPDAEAFRAKYEQALGPKFRVLHEVDHLHCQVAKGKKYP